jgi:hypothetical protein
VSSGPEPVAAPGALLASPGRPPLHALLTLLFRARRLGALDPAARMSPATRSRTTSSPARRSAFHIRRCP